MITANCKNRSKTSEAPVAVAPAAETKPAVEPAPVVEQPVQPVLLTPDPGAKNAQVEITTPFGVMVVKLYDETPWHRDNFLQLVDKKYYDGLIFHRVIKDFMVQGGDPNSRNAAPGVQLGTGGPGYTVPSEFNPALIHKKGALCAARQGDFVNPKRESSGSQFYIVQGNKMNDMQLAQMETRVATKMPGFKYTEEQKNLYKTIGGTPALDMDYTVFGEVVSGLNIIDSIAITPKMPGDRPVTNITMSMTRKK
jgi:peptidyl-prolyl cis-trans isomerase B (cyclophilin B)